MAQLRKFNKRLRPVARNCQFCDNKTIPDYKDTSILAKYMSERGKLLGRARTGICSKHQRLLTTAIKRARHLAFLPFIVRA
jgi:small subunit ribosomal protein S18